MSPRLVRGFPSDGPTVGTLHDLRARARACTTTQNEIGVRCGCPVLSVSSVRHHRQLVRSIEPIDRTNCVVMMCVRIAIVGWGG